MGMRVAYWNSREQLSRTRLFNTQNQYIAVNGHKLATNKHRCSNADDSMLTIILQYMYVIRQL